MKIRLDEWLKREFDPPPAIRTARLWMNAGKIYPAPVKIGRSYYVEDGAVFRDGEQKPRLVHRAFGQAGQAAYPASCELAGKPARTAAGLLGLLRLA
ncbi:hypothetical protein GCT13_45050 [Paraburkholderia sp. CNPSo 3157]|uniref:Excisionase-like domain-containing protein n=2 Tax=Paraburkholderia franconis TaxID=2654983 RepID=A0A7X1TLQ2_9BURK|nr:hypothetical protein [Paraburkholderia franconis]